MKLFIKQLFCFHSSLEEISRERYSVVRGDKSVEGEVTLILCRCKRCGKEKLIPMDRVHFDQEPKVKGGANSLIEAIQGRLLNVDRTEEGKPAGWHTMSCRCEKIIKECYSSFGVEFRDTHDNFCDSPAFYATASPDWVIQYYIEEFKHILTKQL